MDIVIESIKHDIMRKSNLLILLNCVRQFGPVTKRAIQQQTGMSWGTVSNISAELVAKGFLTEKKYNTKANGRTPFSLDINDSDNLIIGIDINIAGLSAVVIDLRSRVRDKFFRSLEITTRSYVLDEVKKLIGDILSEEAYVSKKVIGIGIAMQGSVDSTNGISRYTPFFDDWVDIPLKYLLEIDFNIPVSVLHDPNCMALTEKRIGCAKNVANFLLLRVSIGIGMGIFVDNRLYIGYEGSAGEVGHVIVEPDGVLCTCGGKGCLESYASARGILNAGRLLDKNNSDMTIEEIATQAYAGHEPFLKLFSDAGKYLGITLSGLVNLFNPEMIILSGDMMVHSDLMLSHIEHSLSHNKWKFASTKLEISRLELSAAIGAAISIADKFFLGQTEMI